MSRSTALEERTQPRFGVDSVFVHSLKAIYVMWYRDVLRFKRERARIIASFAQPIVWLALFGTGLAPSMLLGGGAAEGRLDYMKFMFPGIIGMTILFSSIMSGLSVAWDREFGFLKEILVAPVPRPAVAIGKALGGTTVSVIQGALMLIFAPVLGISLDFRMIPELLAVMILLAFSLTSLGIVIAARMRSMETFQVLMQFLLMPLFMLSGAIFPLRDLPAWMNVLVHLDPVTYGIDPLRQIVLRPSLSAEAMSAVALYPIPLDLAIIGGFACLMIALAVWAFNTQE